MNYFIYVPPSIKFFLFRNFDKQILLVHGFRRVYKIILPRNILCSFEKETILKIMSEEAIEKTKTFLRLLELLIVQSSILFLLKIKVHGVGYKFSFLKNKNYLLLYAGFSYPKLIAVPFGIDIKLLTEKGNNLQLKGSNRIQVTQFARQLRNLRIPDSYKGKGVCLHNEKIVLKEGKKQK